MLAMLAIPIIQILQKRDKPFLPGSDFEGTVMITGISGIAKKP
jgi:hypothetical protein